MKKTIAGICNKHGFYRGEFCVECELNPKKEVFYTSKDKMWEFHSRSLGIPIHSKRHWYQELKKRHLTDDVPHYEKGECLENKSKPLDRETVKNTIRQRFLETGTYNKLIKK